MNTPFLQTANDSKWHVDFLSASSSEKKKKIYSQIKRELIFALPRLS